MTFGGIGWDTFDIKAVVVSDPAAALQIARSRLIHRSRADQIALSVPDGALEKLGSSL